MHLDFRRVERPDKMNGGKQPGVDPIVAETGEAIENVVEASVSSSHGSYSRLTVTVVLRKDKQDP